MGEAKRRSSQGLPPKGIKSSGARPADTSPRIVAWLPLSRNQADRFVKLTTKAAWVGSLHRARRGLVDVGRRLIRQILKKTL